MSVSVIIPTYNHAHFLGEALASVRAQTYEGWEAVVVDDGSDDDPAAIVAQYDDVRIRLIRQENRGLSAARNKGIHASTAPHLAFLDADDSWEPTFLATCLAGLATDPAAAGIYTRASYLDERGEALPGMAGVCVRPDHFRRRLLEGGYFPVHAALVQRQPVAAAGFFDESLTSLEDWDLWLRLSQHHYFICDRQQLARYRLSTGSMSSDTTRMHDNRLRVLAKHFGSPTGLSAKWTAEKRRAYAFAQRLAGFDAWEAGDREAARRWLRDAVALWPAIAARTDTYYELAARAVPRGRRGTAVAMDLAPTAAALAAEIEAWLPGEKGQLREARGTLFAALARLADDTGDQAAARQFVRRAIAADPSLIVNRQVARHLFKLHLRPMIPVGAASADEFKVTAK